MTWVKKLDPSWQPQEFPQTQVNDVVDFPGPIDKLVEDGIVALCDKDGKEISTYDTLGKITERELNEFKDWRKNMAQLSLKDTLEKEKESLEAEAKKIKTEIAEDKEAAEAKKKAFVEKMKAAKAAKAAKKTEEVVSG